MFKEIFENAITSHAQQYIEIMTGHHNTWYDCAITFSYDDSDDIEPMWLDFDGVIFGRPYGALHGEVYRFTGFINRFNAGVAVTGAYNTVRVDIDRTI